MTDIQRLSFGRMLRLLQDFYEGLIPFHVMVYRLDCELETADLREPGLRRGWQAVWEPLYEIDTQLDCESQCVDFFQVAPLVQKFADFLVSAQQELDFPKAG
ncbi:MAG TPA: hypothetical protein VMU88_00080 [bacterium]|nr:hypothetical protein [bacterium]